MFHATQDADYENAKWIVYLTPVAASLCTEIKESYTVEPCEVPARDEQHMAFVFGDPLMMGHLQDSYEAKLANSAA